MNPFAQDGGSGFGKLFSGIAGTVRHPFEDLQEAPALPLVTLAREGSFTLEINVVDKRITSRR